MTEEENRILTSTLKGVHKDVRWLRENVVTKDVCTERHLRVDDRFERAEADGTNPRIQVTATPARPDTLGIVARVLALVIAIGTILGGVWYLAGDVQASKSTAAANAQTLKRLMRRLPPPPKHRHR